jgi:arginyl-tRNA synthetase
MDFIEIKHRLFTLLVEIAAASYPEKKDRILELHESQLFFIPDSYEHGFLSSSFALHLQALLKKSSASENPRAVANKLLEKIHLAIQKSDLEKYIKDTTVAGPGFINFYAKDQLFVESAKKILDAPEKWGKTTSNKKNVLIEFTDPNPFKEFHIGHLMSNCIGESLARLYEYSGAKVSRLCYQGDVGMHVAKTLWAWTNNLEKETLQSAAIHKLPLSEKVKLLGAWYAKGAKTYVDGTEKEKNEIKTINEQVFSKENAKINELYTLGKKWSLEAFDQIYKKLGTSFKKFYFESETGPIGKQIVLDNVGTLFEKSKGAIIFPGEKYKLHSRVFINSQGLPTYEAKELGVAVSKDKDFEYDLSIVVTGNEVNDYFKVVLKALEKIDPTIAKKTEHIGHGMLRLPEGKMSSREGNIVTASELMRAVSEKIQEIGSYDDEDLYDTLAVSAIKFSLLKQNIGKDVIFDVRESTSLQGATGVYLQYTHARTNSLIKKSNFKPGPVDQEKLSLTEELRVLYQELFVFPYLISRACQTRSPNLVAEYLIGVAQKYNSFYAKNRIIGSANEYAALLITFLVKNTLANGLHSLGIQPVEKM